MGDDTKQLYTAEGRFLYEVPADAIVWPSAAKKYLSIELRDASLIDLFDKKNAAKWENANFTDDKIAEINAIEEAKRTGKEFANEGLGADIKQFYVVKGDVETKDETTGEYARETVYKTYVTCEVKGNDEREKILLRYVPAEVDKRYHETTLECFKNGEEHGEGPFHKEDRRKRYKESILMTREKLNTGPAFKCELNQWKKSSKDISDLSLKPKKEKAPAPPRKTKKERDDEEKAEAAKRQKQTEEKLAAAERQLALAPQHGAAYTAEAYTGPPQAGSSMLTRDHMVVTIDHLRQMKAMLKEELEGGE